MRRTLRLVLMACVRPLLTLVCVTLPRWWAWVWRPAPQVLPPEWRARQAADEGRRGEHP